MSLVNYYSSSDDENSGDEDDKTDEYVDAEEVGSSAESSNSSRQASELFSSLPAPRSSQISTPEEAESTPSTSVLQGLSHPGRLGFLNLPLPKKRSNQPRKITAPSLPQINSDDEEDEPTAKKQKPAKGLSGLFAMLPKPRSASMKEANRILIPHTLTKRPAPRKPASGKPALSKPGPNPKQAPPTTKSTTAGASTGLLSTSYGSDSDDDEDEGEMGSKASFFSFGSSSKVGSTSSVKPAIELAPSNIIPGPGVTNKVTSPSVHQLELSSHETDRSCRLPQPESSAPLDFGPSSSQDTPLSFKPSSNSQQDSPLEFSKSSNPSTVQYGYHTSQYADQQTYTAPYDYQYSEYNQPYQEQDPPVYADSQGVESAEGQGTGTIQSGATSNFEADKEFQRIMGKRNIGKEAINMIDITADEQIGPNNRLDWMTKSLTEEKEYRVKLKKEQLPSGQQKRKHQITFLAHQAKERELELKNQWANNRQTRQQTQMKYGF